MKLSIVVVSWNVCRDLIECLNSIHDNPPACQFETIVVDNASSDQTVSLLQSRHSQVRLIVNAANLGFPRANNQGIAQATGDYVLLLNPDTVVQSGALDTMTELLDKNADIGAVGPRLLNPDGTTQMSIANIPTFRAALYGKTIFRYTGLFRRHYRKIKSKTFDAERPSEAPLLSGAACLIRRSILDRIGGLDERFFMYYEDNDLFLRIRQAGWRLFYTPNARIIHLGGRSSEQISVQKQYLILKSLILFFRKHRGAGPTFLFNLVFKPALLLKKILDFAKGLCFYIIFLLLRKPQKAQKSLTKAKNRGLFLFRYSIPFLLS